MMTTMIIIIILFSGDLIDLRRTIVPFLLQFLVQCYVVLGIMYFILVEFSNNSSRRKLKRTGFKSL